MGLYDPKKPGIVEADASDAAIGAVFNQLDERGKIRPIAFYSCKFSDAELNYEIHDKELLAIVKATREWRHYIEGASEQTVVWSDHKNLTYFTTTKELTRRQARWSESLSRFDIVIKYRKGSENGRADALSRRPDYMKNVPKHSEAMLQETDEGLVMNKAVLSTSGEKIPVFAIDEVVSKELRDSYTRDEVAQKVLAHLREFPSFTKGADGILRFKELIYLPESLRDTYIAKVHGTVTTGHQGVAKTMNQLSGDYYFPGMKKTIERVLRNCHTCRITKTERHKPYGLMQPNKAPEKR